MILSSKVYRIQKSSMALLVLSIIVKFDNYTFSCNFEIETNKRKKKRSRYCVNKLGTFRRMKHRLRVEKDGNDCESIRVNEIRSELHLRRL